MSGDTSDSVKPWTIRGVPPEERNAAIEAAKRSDMNLGDWLARAIRTHIQNENQSSRAPVPVGQVQTKPSDSATTLDSIERIAAQVQGLAAAGLPVSPAATRRVVAALVGQLPRRPKPGSPTE